MKPFNKISCAILVGVLVFSAAAEEIKLYDSNGNVVEAIKSDNRSEYATYDSDGKLIGTRDADGEIIEYNVEQDPS